MRTIADVRAPFDGLDRVQVIRRDVETPAVADAARPAPLLALPDAPAPKPGVVADPAAQAAARAAVLADEMHVLQRCYSLARRSDPRLGGPITVRLPADAAARATLQVKDENLGDRHIVRCLQREYGSVAVVSEFQAPQTSARTLVIDAAGLVTVSADAKPGETKRNEPPSRRANGRDQGSGAAARQFISAL